MRVKIRMILAWLVAVALLLVAIFSDPVLAQTYYQGKTITVVRGGEPGGVGDMQAKALIPYLKKHIPGGPNIVVEHMPGAAGMKAVNYIYSSANPDGLRIGAVGAGLVSGPILGLPGAKYDLEKLLYLGSTESGDPYLFITRKEAGLDSLEKLRTAPGVRIGAQTVGHSIYVSGRMFAYMLGLKDPKFVVGFGGPELDLALLRGEVDARTKGTDTILHRNREDFDKGLFHVHAAITIPKGKIRSRFAGLPDLETFTQNETERRLLNLFQTFLYPRWPYFLPPGTPLEIVKTLRGAMTKALNDPQFHKEFKKLMGADPSPLTGEEVEAAIRELPRDPGTIALYKKFAEHGALPPR